MEVLNWILANYGIILAGLVGLLSAALGIALVIPGDQPDKFLRSAVDFLSKFSIKKSE